MCGLLLSYALSQSGIGTYNVPQIAKPMMAKFKRLLDSMMYAAVTGYFTMVLTVIF